MTIKKPKKKKLSSSFELPDDLKKDLTEEELRTLFEDISPVTVGKLMASGIDIERWLLEFSKDYFYKNFIKWITL